ncbi:MAG: cytochrome c [Acidobacteriaceae bacterium]|nr:cytochrome c [Acidobacteriaceae bacterium]
MRALITIGLMAVATMAAVAQESQDSDQIERGRYVSILGDCSACHTKPGGRPFAGGIALRTPFGTILASNITPDKETGIGTWTEAEFISAVRDGRGHNGTRLYPAMPYTAYTKMSDDDVVALRAYMRTVVPVRNRVDANQLPFPYNIRLALAGWNLLNFRSSRFEADPTKSPDWNRGAYLVQGPGHCGTCHTPKTVIGSDKVSSALSGGVLIGWFAPSLTTDVRTGVGGWSQDEIEQYLKHGANVWTIASGPMAEVVSRSTSQMTDRDVAAIALYLKQSGITGKSSDSALISLDEPMMRVGAILYKDNCAACHKDNGTGERLLFPRLAGSPSVQSDNPTTLARVVLQGARAGSTSQFPTAPAMPAFDWRLNDAQIAAVLTYIRNSWGNAAPPVSVGSIEAQRKALATSAYRYP